MRSENPSVAAQIAATIPAPRAVEPVEPPSPSWHEQTVREDPDEAFDNLAEQMILTADPDSLPFLKAAKHASARGSPAGKNAVGRKDPDAGSVVKPSWA